MSQTKQMDPIAEELDRAGVEAAAPRIANQPFSDLEAMKRRAARARHCPKCNAPTMRAVAFETSAASIASCDGFCAEIRQCEVCSTRIAFGELMPRIVVKPYEKDRRLVVVTIFDPNVFLDDGRAPSEPMQVVVDRGLAKLWATALSSVGV